MLLIAGIATQIGCLARKSTPKDLSKNSFILYMECNGYYNSPPYGDVVLVDLNAKQKTQITYDSFWDGRSCFWKSRNSIIFLSKRSNNQYYKHSRGSEPARLYEYNLKTQEITKVPKQTDFLDAKDHRGEKYGSIESFAVSSYNDSIIAFVHDEAGHQNITVANIISGKKVLNFVKPVVSGYSVLTKDYLLVEIFNMRQVIRADLNSQKVDTIPSPWQKTKMLNVKDAKENTVYFAILDNDLPAIYTYNIATQKYTFVKQFAQGEFGIEYRLSFFNHVFNDSTYLITDIDKEQHENLFLYHSNSKKREQLTNDTKNKSYVQVIQND